MNEANCAVFQRGNRFAAAAPCRKFRRRFSRNKNRRNNGSCRGRTSRQPCAWKKSWRFFSAVRNAPKLLMSTFAAAASCSTQWLKLAGELTVSALSGRNAGQHFRGMAGLGEDAMIFEAVHRVVRGADDLHLEFFQDALRGERGRGEFFVRRFPDFFGGRFVQQIVDAEIALQFQMRPVIKRIAERVRHGFGPREKFVMRRGVAGAEFFRDAVACASRAICNGRLPARSQTGF